MSKLDYKSVIHEKLHDPQLRKNLKGVMDTLKANREKIVSTRFSNWQELRNIGQNIKIHALSNLDSLLEQFESNAIKNGFKIHWAKDGEEANKIILDIMKEKKATKILKQKSMASEEIHLNSYLKKHGIDAKETDLGELIIQLIDEPPVHIVAPAIHKNRYEIGEIFQTHLKSELESEPEKLNAIARKHLRAEFKEFSIGLSGVNFAVADTGSIWLVENEGNGRMSTTACDTHIAICGIEKIVESFDQATMLNNLLVPSAVGAPVTCYNNIISGPRKSDRDELDGPRECHIIMLDNNRSNMLKDPHFYRSLSCIRCGTCLNHCPVYDKIGGHAYLSTYPGPIGEVISPQIFGLGKFRDMLDLCSLCGRCSEVCPVKIPLAELIRDLRSERVGEGRGTVKGDDGVRNGVEKRAMSVFTSLATSGSKWRFVLFMADHFAFMGKIFGSMVPGLSAWLQFRAFPTLSGNLHSKVKNLKGVIYE